MLCSPGSLSLLQSAYELRQLVVVQIRDGPEGHSGTVPAAHVKSADDIRFDRLQPLRIVGVDQDVDRVLVSLVHERRYGSALQVVEPSPEQWKSSPGKVNHWRREVQLPQEPGLDGVLIG